MLVSLADHGLTPSALAARLTFTGAPEAPQGAVAAGLLGAGSVFLGPAGDTAHFLADTLAEHVKGDLDDESLRRVAEAAVDRLREEGRRVPGLGHRSTPRRTPAPPGSTNSPPRRGCWGPTCGCCAVADAHEQRSGRHLAINGAGAAGAALVDLGVPPGSVRSFVLIGRTVGLVGHLAEEEETPLGMPLWREVEHRSSET